jgi:hypothetical protein
MNPDFFQRWKESEFLIPLYFILPFKMLQTKPPLQSRIAVGLLASWTTGKNGRINRFPRKG